MGKLDVAQLQQRLAGIALGDYGRETLSEIIAEAEDLGRIILESIKDGRERALAITKLEELVFWCQKGIEADIFQGPPTPEELD